MKKRKGTALVTGASSGIGLELANCLARGGYDLVLVARNREKLKEVANTLSRRHNNRVLILVKDLSRPAAPQKIFEELQRANVQIDVLVNNAGLGAYGHFAEADVDRMLSVMQVNMAALTHLTRLFLPQMIERGRGRVLNVASTAAFQPGPLMAVYFASKAYVLSLSEALSNEVKGSGVSITCLCPGPTQSDFQNRAQMSNSKLSENNLMSASQVANIGCRAMMRGQTLVIPGNNNAFWAWFTRLLPRSATPKIVRRVQDTKTSFVETAATSSTRTPQIADNSSLDESHKNVSP
ncbi:MAG TPA: SDR family oxidoreductase [Abditibacteriaceae bacterium]|nr:SDR family oxidoreductase [Abditibacteriaceae bacterium]